MADQKPQETGSSGEQSDSSGGQRAPASPATSAATPASAALPAAGGVDSALRAAFDSLSLRTPEASRHAADSPVTDEARSVQDSAGVTGVAAEGRPHAGDQPAVTTDAANTVPDAQLSASPPHSADAHGSRNDHQSQAHGAMQPAAEPAPMLTPAEDSGRSAADGSPEPATPPASSGVSLVIPSAAVTVVPATPSAPDAEPRIKVHTGCNCQWARYNI